MVESSCERLETQSELVLLAWLPSRMSMTQACDGQMTSPPTTPHMGPSMPPRYLASMRPDTRG
jgi:hypothetical protein